MASLIPGYEYDIFISYRQKDNKHDGWVTEFVENLKGELESTFKEDISVYFDINPHDGLLETHDVDASLKEKLKCLIFIPIISRTYCDPKSFAWEHEFKAFVEQASNDQYGLKVKLPNGNVINRVLPIRIHDLDDADIKLCESVIGSVLRGIELIYKEPGVNRSLTPEDDENKNLNKTKYRNQINKVALSIKDIILSLDHKTSNKHEEKAALKAPLNETLQTKYNIHKINPLRSKTTRILSGIFITVALACSVIFIFPRIFKHDTFKDPASSDGRTSIAVMPFQNITNDTNLIFIGEALQDNMINILSNYSAELIIRGSESVNAYIKGKGLVTYSSITPSMGAGISRKLDANIFICGKITKLGSVVRLNAQLIDPVSEEVFRSFQIENPSDEENIFHLIDSISQEVKNYLLMYRLKKEYRINQYQNLPTVSVEAYRYYRNGINAFRNRNFTSACNYYSLALKADSNLIAAAFALPQAYYNNYTISREPELLEKAKASCLEMYKKKDFLSERQKISLDKIHAEIFETTEEVIKQVNKLIALDDKAPGYYYNLGYYNTQLGKDDKAIPAFEMSLKIYKEWGVKPNWSNNYYFLGYSYLKTGQISKAKKLYKDAVRDFPENSRLSDLRCKIAIAENKPGRTERICREEYSKYPNNIDIATSYAYFLFNSERNVEEGMTIIDNALAAFPKNVNLLMTKAFGLYKIGEYTEAIDMFEKVKRTIEPLQDPDLNQWLEAAKKAVAGQKDNI